MQISQLPAKFQIPFANSAGAGYIRTVPVPSQIGITTGAASLTDGFPPVCFQPVGAGGTPPSGQDFNGLLNQITLWARWQSAGGPVYYDATFSGNIGGYPAGAIVSAASALGNFWLSLVDNNTSDPDTGGANWLGFSVPGYANIIHSGIDAGTADNVQVPTSGTGALTPAISAYQAGMVFCIKIADANATTTPKFQVGSLGQLTITRADGTSCQPGDLIPSDWTFLVCAGSTMQIVGLATNNLVSSNILEFSSTTTWTVPAGVYKVKRIQVWGAGGGGSGCTGATAAGNGGGGGGYAEALGVAVTPGATITVTIGAGGAGGVGFASGSNGGTTTFGSTTPVGATGGGAGTTTNVGVGGTGTGGALNIQGQQGGSGSAITYPGGTAGAGGAGGACPMGGGGYGGFGFGSNGGPGLFPGGAGDGGSTTNSGGSANGGTGAGALIVIEW